MYYPDGFAAILNAVGSTYIKPPRGSPVLNFADANIAFAGGPLDQNFVNAIALDLNNRVFDQSDNGLRMSFSLGNGTFSGWVQDPSSLRYYPFHGVVLQKANTAVGFFQAYGLSGDVSIIGTD